MTARNGLEVLHCDNHLLVVVKPAGMPSVPDESGDPSSFDVAREWVQREFAKPGVAFLGVVHRLDRPVSGVIAFARTSKAAARLSEQLREHEAGKLYWAIGEGRRARTVLAPHARRESHESPALPGSPRSPASPGSIGSRVSPGSEGGELEEWLLKDEARNVVTPVRANTPAAKRAITRWRVLAETAEHTLYEFRPQTGRPHQLRSCARALGTPLRGDLKYGARDGFGSAIALHAAALHLRHPTRAEELLFTCAPPKTGPWGIEAFHAVLDERLVELRSAGALD